MERCAAVRGCWCFMAADRHGRLRGSLAILCLVGLVGLVGLHCWSVSSLPLAQACGGTVGDPFTERLVGLVLIRVRLGRDRPTWHGRRARREATKGRGAR